MRAHRPWPARFVARGPTPLALQRRRRPRIDHRGLDAVGGHDLRRFQGPMHHPRQGDGGDVRALALDIGLAEGDVELAVRHLALDPHDPRVVDEDRRVVAFERRADQALDVGGCRGQHHLEPGDIGEHTLGAR